MKAVDSYSKVFKEINNILVVLAHPDDMEINCGGLMSRLIEDGKNVRLVITTNGGKGTKNKNIEENAFAKSRTNEQIKAGEKLGLPKEENFNLQIPDGEIESNLDTIEKIVRHIRQFKPDIVITHNPEDFIIHFFDQGDWINHRDHRNTAQATLDAVYPYSRDTNFFPDQLKKEKLTTHTVKKILLADSYLKREVKYFDISKQIHKKLSALKEHKSAFDPESAGDYVEENKIGDGYFEPLGYYEVY